MSWHPPLPLRLIPTEIQDSFGTFGEGVTGLPLSPHPGAFGVQRKHHTHEGVDLYCSDGTPVSAVEDGIVVALLAFTGAQATPPSPWWHDTQALLIEGSSGVVVYGEIEPLLNIEIGAHVKAGQKLGWVKQVLKVNKGRPMSMLHLELHQHGTRDALEWEDKRPETLLDPTPYLLEIGG